MWRIPSGVSKETATMVSPFPGWTTERLKAAAMVLARITIKDNRKNIVSGSGSLFPTASMKAKAAPKPVAF